MTQPMPWVVHCDCGNDYRPKDGEIWGGSSLFVISHLGGGVQVPRKVDNVVNKDLHGEEASSHRDSGTAQSLLE